MWHKGEDGLCGLFQGNPLLTQWWEHAGVRGVWGMGEADGFQMHLLSTLLRSGHLKWTDRTFRKRQQGTLRWPVYVWEWNTNEPHGHAREQLPPYSTTGPKVVYKGKGDTVQGDRSEALDLCSLWEVRWCLKRLRRDRQTGYVFSTNLSLPGLFIHQSVFVYGVPNAASSSIAQLPAVLHCSIARRHLALLPMLFHQRMWRQVMSQGLNCLMWLNPRMGVALINPLRLSHFCVCLSMIVYLHIC